MPNAELLIAPEANPLVARPLRCRVGLHDERPMTVSRGAMKRMVIRRHGCVACGRVRQYRSYGMGWGVWGYMTPDQVREQLREPVVTAADPVADPIVGSGPAK